MPFCFLIRQNDFNPRSHKGSDVSSSTGNTVFKISIHAPTRGATRRLTRKSNALQNFNPRSHKGSDLRVTSRLSTRQNFNPRSHKGSDLRYKRNKNRAKFQSTLPQGERQVRDDLLKAGLIISIHAPTRGATGGSRLATSESKDFNPRSHNGSDIMTTDMKLPITISIHAPTRGATATARLTSLCH